MLTFRFIVCLIILTQCHAVDFQPQAFPRAEIFPTSFMPKNVIIRAEALGKPVKYDHIDLVSLGVDRSLNPLLSVEGRICLKIDQDTWCDIIKQNYDLPGDKIEILVEQVDGGEFMLVTFREGQESITVGKTRLNDDQISEIELSDSVLLFFDKHEEVPALMWLAPSQDNFKSRQKKARFEEVYKDLN